MSILYTPGVGNTIAADRIGTGTNPTTGQDVQYVKLDIGTLGNSSPILSTNPLPVQVSDGTHTMPTGDAVARPIFHKLTDGTTVAKVAADDGSLLASSGGSTTGTVAAVTAANTVIKNAAGRLCRVLVTTAGTGSNQVLIYDNATTNSGTVIGVIPATITIGNYYTFDIPAANGITVANVTNGPGLTVSFN